MDVGDALGIAGVTAQVAAGTATRCGAHTLPEGDGYRGVIPCHGCEDETHVVGFAFVFAAVVRIGKLEADGGHSGGYLCGALTYC